MIRFLANSKYLYKQLAEFGTYDVVKAIVFRNTVTLYGDSGIVELQVEVRSGNSEQKSELQFSGQWRHLKDAVKCAPEQPVVVCMDNERLDLMFQF